MNSLLSLLIGAIAPSIPNAVEILWEEYKTDVANWFPDEEPVISKNSNYYNSIKEHTDD